MISLLLTALAVLMVLLISEWGWQKGWLANEFGRKFVHIIVGSFVAFWPLYLSWQQIRLFSLAFLVVVIASTYLGVFKAIRSVQRPTYGEIFFAITVGLLTFLTSSRAIYAAAILQMSLADGLAAVVGVRFGRDNKYLMLGYPKSVIGSLTFWAVSTIILLGYSMLAVPLTPLIIMGGALAMTLIENVGIYGADNLLVPLLVTLFLTYV